MRETTTTRETRAGWVELARASMLCSVRAEAVLRQRQELERVSLETATQAVRQLEGRTLDLAAEWAQEVAR